MVHRYAVLRIALLLGAALAGGGARAQDRAAAASILVLDDGGVLAGDIVRDGNYYAVKRGGALFRIAASRVSFECGSLEEAYQRRRQSTRPTVDSHLALADWCLRYELHAQARQELTDAQRLDATHPRLALLQRRLVNAEREASRASEPTGSTGRDATIASAGPAVSQILESAPEVPAAVVERFTRKVQPILVNNCTASGCHAAGGDQPFQLDRGLLHGMANRRSTMSNLAAALALVDREQPQQSPLLTVPRQTHGEMENPIFGPRQEAAFNHLVEWVALVTPVDRKPESETAAPPVAAAETNDDEVPSNEVVQVDHEADASAVLPAIRQLRFGAQAERWEPRDPFDPEIFNRRHRPQRPGDR